MTYWELVFGIAIIIGLTSLEHKCSKIINMLEGQKNNET
jgi:hypothetical protein